MDLAPLPPAKSARILIVGDVMLDRFVYGTVERVSPEAPVPVLKFERDHVMLGGAANVAVNVADFGARAELIGLIGGDEAGRTLDEFARNAERLTFSLVRSRSRATTTKVRLVAGRHQIARLDTEANHDADDAESAQLLDRIREGLARADILVLSDYAKGCLTNDVLRGALDLARAAGVPVVVDPKRTDFSAYNGATIIAPNLHELERAANARCLDDVSVVSCARRLLDGLQIESMLVTRGAQGMSLVKRTGGAEHLPAQARQVFDVSGAGDTVVAVLSVLLAEGLPPEKASAAANIAAGLVVEKAGTATVTRTELISEIRHRQEQELDAKILTVEAAVLRREAWKTSGKSVVFANGCFDLLHPGHVSLLRRARAAGDRLIVGLNSDSSVRRLKGENRPVQDVTARSIVLSALGFVDAVVVFEDDTPMALIEALKPDILVKGADYTAENVVGADFVRSYGGQLLLLSLEEGHSTTGIVARMSPAEDAARSRPLKA